MPDKWVWGAYVLRHLKAMLRVCQPLIDHGKRYVSIPDPMEGMLEWTLSMGFDDGVGRVRLTLVNAPGARNDPLRVRVIVAAGARGFNGPTHGIVLPRYGGSGEAAPAPHHDSGRQARDMELTRHMAAYLLKHTGGDPQSLNEEADGLMSFTVIVALPPDYAAREPAARE